MGLEERKGFSAELQKIVKSSRIKNETPHRGAQESECEAIRTWLVLTEYKLRSLCFISLVDQPLFPGPEGE